MGHDENKQKIRLYRHPSPPLQIIYKLDSSRRVLNILFCVLPKVQATNQVFISYSHRDVEWLKVKLKQFLHLLRNGN